VRERQLPAVYLLHVAHALYSSDSCLSILSPYYHLLPSPCENQSMCVCEHVSVCGYVCVCVKPGDRGVEIRTRRVSSWKEGCTCALNLRTTDPAQLGFRSAYISATQRLSLLSVTVDRNPTTTTAYLLFQTIGGGLPPSERCSKLKTRIGARQRQYGSADFCLSSCSSLPAPWPAKISHMASHPHNTLVCNHTSLPPPPHPHHYTS